METDANQNEFYGEIEDTNCYNEDAYNLDVWLDLFPELGLHTLKRIKTRLESGEYKLDNFIPEDVLRRQLDKHIGSLHDLVEDIKPQSTRHLNLQKLPTKKYTSSHIPKKRKPSHVYITKCRHQKFIRKKTDDQVTNAKVSRATSPYFSAELLENVLVEELVAETIAQNTHYIKSGESQSSNKTSSLEYDENLNPIEVLSSYTSSSDSSEDADSIKVFYSDDTTSDETRETFSTSDASAETVVRAKTTCDLDNIKPENSDLMASNGGRNKDLSSRIWCEKCNSILVELRRQAVKIWMPYAAKRKVFDKDQQCELLAQLEASLHVPERLKKSLSLDQCQLCGTTVTHLKSQTYNMVHSLERTTQKALSSSNVSSGSGSTQQVHGNQGMMTRGSANGSGGSRIPTAMSSKGGIVHLPRGQSSSSGAHKQQIYQHAKALKQQRTHAGGPEQQHQSSHPNDLPPRKDSPFPQAIASEKYQKDRRTSHHRQQQQHRQNNSHAWLLHNQRLYNQMLNGNIPSSNGRRTPSSTSKLTGITKMESLTPQDYANMNGHHIDPTTGLQYSNTHVGSHQQQHQQQMMLDRPGMLQLQQNHQHIASGSPTHSYHHQQQHYHHQQQQQNGGVGGNGRGLQYHNHQQQQQQPQQQHQGVLLSPGGSTSSTGSSTAAAVSFFARAAQKLNISSKKRKKKDPPEPDPPPFPTNFRSVLEQNPPPVPPCLMRMSGSKLQNQSTGKVKVVLRICPLEGNHPGNYLNLDQRKKQVTVYDPTAYSGYTTPSLRRPVAPRLFEFDSVFSQDDALAELCCSGLVDIVQSVVGGSDGCIFSYGHARLGKTYTMIGVDEGSQNLGIIPCSISWLFRLIEMQKERTGARFSVRVSAVEVTGKNETLKDLLADVASAQDTCVREKAPGVYLREDPICGTQLENQSELWAPTADKAAYYLDAAVAARTVPEVEEDARNSHLLFTIHVYQYRVEKGARSGSTADGVAGGRSRLHLLDLGSCSKSSKDGNSLSLHALGMAILALLNGQRHVPHRESKLTQLIRESIGNVGCKTCMIAHVSPAIHAYNETLQVIQLAAKIHRTKRRRKMYTSSDDSSCDGESVRRRMRTGIRMGTLREMSHSDPDYTSSSEQSCDTVIYVGPYGNCFSDEGLTDNERPPTSIPVMPTRNIAHIKIQPRTVPTFSRSRSHSGDESGSDGDRSTVVSHHSSSSHGASSVNNCDHRLSSGRVTPRMIPEPKMIPSSIAKPRIGPSPLTFHQHGYSSSPSNSQTSHHHHHHHQDPSLFGPAPLPGYFHTHGPETQQKSSNSQSEQWIDGPMMGPYSKSSSSSIAASSSNLSSPMHEQKSGKHGGPKPVVNPAALNEQWIDGPKEFLVGRGCSSNNNNTKTLSNETVESASNGSNTNRPSLLPKATSSRIPSTKSASIRELKSYRHCERKSELTQTVLTMSGSEYDSSSPVKKIDSTVRSNDLHTNCDKKPEVGNNTCSNCAASSSSTTPVPVKSFVKDWVEKHSGMPSSDSGSEDRHKSRLSKSGGSSSSGGKKSKLPHVNPQASLDAMLYGKEKQPAKRNTTNSPHSSPKSRLHLNKAVRELPNLPQQSESSSNKRTLAWVQSVQDSVNEQTENTDCPTEPKAQTGEIIETHDSVIAEIDTKVKDSDDNYTQIEKLNFSPPAEYESLVFTSSKLENVEEVTEEESANESEDAEGACQNNDNAKNSGLTKIDEMLDSSFDSEPAPHSNELGDDTNLFMNNRESIYELQFELETSRSSIRNSFHSEDDAWSLGSIPKDLDSETYAVLETKDVDNVQVPALDSTYASQTLDSCKTGYSQTQVSTLDSGNCTQLDHSFATTAESSKVVQNDLDTSTGISTMDSRGENTGNNHFVFVTDNSELSPLVVDASEHEKTTEEYISSSDYKSSEIKSPIRPSFLRRPDGASNPNLFEICETPKSSSISSPGEETLYHVSSGMSSPITPPYLKSDFHDYATIADRSVIGQSPDSDGVDKSVIENKNFYKEGKEIKSHFSANKSSLSPTKPSVLPKPSNSKDLIKDKPAVPPRTSSKLSSPHKEYSRSSSLKGDNSYTNITQQQQQQQSSESSHTTSSFTRSLSAPVKSSTPLGKSKDKHKSSSPPSPATRPSSMKPPKNSFTSRLPLCSSKKGKETQSSSPTKSSASSGKESKSSKDSKSSSKDSCKSSSAKDSRSSLKDSKYSSKDSKNSSSKSSTKDSKSSTKGGKESKSSTFSRSKSPSPSKKDRESKLPLGKLGFKSRSKGCESDSGIESGRIKSDHLLLSPAFLSKQHRPRISMHSTSSGHGSDVSSTFSGPAAISSKYGTTKESRVDVCNSSGYESMLRDSEMTGTSSSHDSTSESGQSDRSSSKIPKKRSYSSKRSKSAPAYSGTSTPVSSRLSSPSKKLSSPAIGSPKFWPDSRWGPEPLEIKVYEIEDVERMARRRKEELELREVARRRVKIRELLQEQEDLKDDLHYAKSLLMVEPESWSFDLHVAEQMDRDDPDFLEALEKETQILQKRVEACKSRIMMVTCFDNTITTSAATVSS